MKLFEIKNDVVTINIDTNFLKNTIGQALKRLTMMNTMSI